MTPEASANFPWLVAILMPIVGLGISGAGLLLIRYGDRADAFSRRQDESFWGAERARRRHPDGTSRTVGYGWIPFGVLVFGLGIAIIVLKFVYHTW
jgi:hypothetical protein